MKNEMLLKIIAAQIKKEPCAYQAYMDYKCVCEEILTEDVKAGTRGLVWLSEEMRNVMPEIARRELSVAQELILLHRQVLKLAATEDFDSYLQYVEFDRKPEDQFYNPRRGYLRRIGVPQAYQELADGKLKLLTISMPKRAGKSQTGINFVDFLSGRKPNLSTLMEGAGDDLVKSFYTGCLEYMVEGSGYLFRDLFPRAPLVQTNADTKIINLDERSRFPTIMCRSIDARQIGLSEATNLLYLDDCVEGREEAKNKARLDEKWEVISGDVLGRAVECPIVIAGTRYSLYDPIGRLQEYARQMGWAWESIEVPALDEKTGESNYEYYNPKLGKRIFTTKSLNEQKELLTAEQWESEFQQQPFEAKGLMFPKSKLNRYFELPVDVDPDAIIAVCDTAEGRGDSVMLPVAYVYGQDVFIVDVVFDDSPPGVTKVECANMLVKHKVGSATFESNGAGTYYARDVDELVKKNGGNCSIKTKRTISNKHTRIENASDWIIRHFYFKDESLYEPHSQYGLMMKELTTYTRTGKMPHDDAPDGLSLLENDLRNIGMNKVEIVKRQF